MAEKIAKIVPFNKEQYIEKAQAQIEEFMGTKLSKDGVWRMTKAIIGILTDMAATGHAVSLSGICKAEVMISKRSGKKKMKIRPSTKINALLDEGKSVYDWYSKDSKDEPSMEKIRTHNLL
jgi:hypothetical protein